MSLSKEKGAAVVPLLANLFACEIAIFNIAFDRYRKVHGGPATLGDYHVMLAVYLAERLPETRYDIVNGLPRYFFASITWTWNDQQHVEVRDVSCEPLPNVQRLSLDVEDDELPSELLEILTETRNSQFSAYDLFFAAYAKRGDDAKA
ncbi:hypothetical protein GC163_17335 [bacterium]|nr:hypothetical protein [bacterium]